MYALVHNILLFLRLQRSNFVLVIVVLQLTRDKSISYESFDLWVFFYVMDSGSDFLKFCMHSDIYTNLIEFYTSVSKCNISEPLRFE